MFTYLLYTSSSKISFNVVDFDYINPYLNFTFPMPLALGNHEFYIVHINNFCYAHSHKKNYLAEIAVSRFNLLNGVNADKVFHRMIKPGPLPLGYSYEAKKNSEESHQIPPPWGQDVPDNTTEVFRELVAFLMVIFTCFEMFGFKPSLFLF